MNFGKAKKVLIFLFLFINLFLISILANQSNKGALSAQSVKKTIAILEKNHVTLDKKIIPKKTKSADTLQFYSPLRNKTLFLKNFPNTTFESNGSFVSDLSLPISENTPKAVLNALYENGFETYALSHLLTNQNPVTGETQYIFSQTYNGDLISGADLTVYVQNKTVCKATGSLLEIENAQYSDFSLLSPLQILIQFSTDVKHTGKAYKISDMYQAYYISSENKNYERLTATSCYTLKVHGNFVYYDAVSGSFVGMLTHDGVSVTDMEQALQLL